MKAETLDRLKEIERAFHQRAFGEELARVNFLPLEQRRTYLRRLRERAARHRPTGQARLP